MITDSKSEREAAPVVVLFGPTAVGKTALLLELFRERAEVVSADSMQVYRGMDIGTAKPGADVAAQLPHHLIDIREPDQGYSVGEFVRDADRLIPEIAARRRLPVVSGGSAFYLRNFIYGLPAAPRSDRSIKRDLERECERLGLAVLREELERVDPITASRLPAADHYRVIRALEVYRSTGVPLSSFLVPHRPRSGYRFLVIGLERERSELYERINRRVDEMMERGLQREVAALLDAGYGFTAPALRAIGYREFAGYFDGSCSLERTAELIRRNSRRYAKRQITFFRQLPEAIWFPADERDAIAALVREFEGRSAGRDS